jgi:plastocyanin
MSSAPAQDVGKRRMRRAALLLAGSILAGVGSVSAAEPKAAVHTVVVEGMQFSPATLEVNAGDTVVWENKDPYPHTATSASDGFDSGEIPPRRGWTLTAEKRGTFSYVCTLHPTMKARLIVK